MIASGREGQEDKSHLAGLRTVAALECTKGLLVAVLGCGLISLSRHDVDFADLALSLLYGLHISPVQHLSQAFLDAAARLDDANLKLVAVGAAAYSMLRFLEAYGLWNGRVWAEWFALVSGAAYLPLEIYGLFRRSTPVRWVVLAVNVLIVLYMAYIRIQARMARSEVARHNA